MGSVLRRKAVEGRCTGGFALFKPPELDGKSI